MVIDLKTLSTEQAQELYDAHGTASRLADYLGMKYATCYRHLKDLGVNLRVGRIGARAKSESETKRCEDRNALMARARQGDRLAARQLKSEYRLKVYTPEEIDDYRRNHETPDPAHPHREIISRSLR